MCSVWLIDKLIGACARHGSFITYLIRHSERKSLTGRGREGKYGTGTVGRLVQRRRNGPGGDDMA